MSCISIESGAGHIAKLTPERVHASCNLNQISRFGSGFLLLVLLSFQVFLVSLKNRTSCLLQPKAASFLKIIVTVHYLRPGAADLANIAIMNLLRLGWQLKSIDPRVTFLVAHPSTGVALAGGRHHTCRMLLLLLQIHSSSRIQRSVVTYAQK